MKTAITIIITGLLLSSCAFENRNAHENESVQLLQHQSYDDALKLIEPAANQGYPWAQMRLGLAYASGKGKPRDYVEAVKWFRLAGSHQRTDAWSEGASLLFPGDDGFYNQNNTARAAYYFIARINYLGGAGVKRDLVEAWKWAKVASLQSEGKDITYCCDTNKLNKQVVESARVNELLAVIEKKLSPDQLASLGSMQMDVHTLYQPVPTP